MGQVEGAAKRTTKKPARDRRERTRGDRRGRAGSGAAPAPTTEQLRELLDAALSEVDGDARLGSLLHAKGMSLRLRITDLDLTLTVVPSDGSSHHLQWRFDDAPGWEPKLELAMSAEVANSYLQGGESLAVALARGRVRASGDARYALFGVPALRLFLDVYRRKVHERHPELALV